MDRISVDSSNLVSVGYDDHSSILEVEFKNGVYQYFDVPLHIFNELLNSDSKGSYFHANVRYSYSCDKV